MSSEPTVPSLPVKDHQDATQEELVAAAARRSSQYSGLIYNTDVPQCTSSNYTPYRRGKMDDWDQQQEQAASRFESYAKDRVTSMSNYGQPIDAVRRASVAGTTVAASCDAAKWKPPQERDG
ncbi:hypothetical protein BV898_17369 [Hypsibius exemplaris]|uniref:Uncharacterized protein n=1 Tax=Hypsibius exemplaris TaxID=2072580 RepID=A0A9X6RMI1_HYPEX|nr:hypothetical protein BV898_17369 [Hypsibius exemplaris]